MLIDTSTAARQLEIVAQYHQAFASPLGKQVAFKSIKSANGQETIASVLKGTAARERQSVAACFRAHLWSNFELSKPCPDRLPHITRSEVSIVLFGHPRVTMAKLAGDDS